MELNLGISIIVPAYNAEAVIEECLKTICHESKKLNSEIIVEKEMEVEHFHNQNIILV